MARVLIDLTGRGFGRLTAVRRLDDYVSPSGLRRTRWLCRCDCGSTVEVLGDNLRAGRTRSCGCLRNELSSRRAKVLLPAVTYNAAHRRLGRSLGTAKRHPCPCGRGAQEWAYDHADPKELREVAPSGRVFAYSLDPSHYRALCKSCHAKFDRHTNNYWNEVD